MKCLECNEEKKLLARGICSMCYARLTRKGNLNKYPSLKRIKQPRVCPICKKEFLYKHYIHVCCCRDCGTKHRENNYGGRNTIVNCKICNKEFTLKNYALKNRIYFFCSRKCYGIERKAWMKTEKYNPTLNKGHTDNTREILSNHLIRRLHDNPSSIKGTHKSGKRKDLNNLFVRSSWEANFARYLNYKGIKWVYEPKTFMFEAYKIGTRSYTPDFYLTESDTFIEIKGWFDRKSMTKIRRFKKFYPEHFNKMLFVINTKRGKCYKFLKELDVGDEKIMLYSLMEKEYKETISNWETRIKR